MTVLSIIPQNFRNLEFKKIEFDAKLNFVFGENAAGKTSLLESIYFLSTGKSFRSRNISHIANTKSEGSEFVLFGSVKTHDHNEAQIGIRKAKQERSIIKINGKEISTASELAILSPTIIVEPRSFELIHGSPKLRRQFLDWGVFHVEHNFSSHWKDYINCMKQRNSLLRAGRIDHSQLAYWDGLLGSLGESIDICRTGYIDTLELIFRRNCVEYELPEGISLKYFKGWEKGKSFPDYLIANRDKDTEKKFTQYGPHRADIKLNVDGMPAEHKLSRGQQKLLVMALYLSQIEMVYQRTLKPSVVLIDDVTSELDHENLSRLFTKLQTSCAQIVCTGLEKDKILSLVETNTKYKMFHVEHGKIKTGH